MFPSVSNPKIRYLYTYNGKTHFFAESGSQPDNDNTWSEMVVTGVSHGGSATYLRANTVQKFIYTNAVQYRWNEQGYPFGTTTLTNDTSVTTNVEWK